MVARRIVSLVPSMTETLFELGHGEQLVACTRYCAEPEGPLRFVPRVGGTKNPDLEQIASLEPDLVVVNSEENRAEHIGWLGERFTVLESMPRTAVEAGLAVKALGDAIGAADEAEAIQLAIEAELARAEVEGIGLQPVRTFYAIWKSPWMAVNRETYIHDVLTRAGARNVTAERPGRYPVVPIEAMAGLGAELVLLPSEPFVFNALHREELVQSKAFGDAKVLLCDGRDFCWHGARTPKGIARAVGLLKEHRHR